MTEVMDQVLNHPLGRGVLLGGVLVGLMMGVGAFSTYLERKFAGRIQNRLGPTIVGPFGLFQVIADGIKMLRKEIIIPRAADPVLFLLAPIVAVTLTLASAAVIPFAEGLEPVVTSVGLLWLLAFSGLLVFPVWWAGWASNNKYALFGSMRAVAQGVSYEIPLVMAALVPVILAGSLDFGAIVAAQKGGAWFIWSNPVGAIAFIIFFLASLAEANRIPFDIPEAESELIAGPSVEYTGILWGMFPLAEYIHTFIASAVASLMFFGGWLGPGPDGLHWMALKTGALYLAVYWLRWSLVRFRSDQLMRFCWHWLVPISLALIVIATLWVHAGFGGSA